MASKNAPKQESGLQAVIIADNFNIQALSLGTSWALLPLAGARIIDYTIEFLLQTPVDEVIIFSVFQAQKVENYVRERWITPGLVPFRITFMCSQHCRGIGDAIRDIDSKALIKSDFLLTQAGFVSNFDFGTALAAHKSRRIKDKKAVITLIYSNASINHPARVRDLDAFVVLDSVTNRLLHCQYFSNTSREFEYPMEVLTMNDEITTRLDLLDCNMAICSEQIPPLFSDNFDFQTRRHILREILTNEEILAYRAYAHVVEGKQAVFIGDLNTYLTISQSILERWCYPIVPEALNTHDASVAVFSSLKKVGPNSKSTLLESTPSLESAVENTGAGRRYSCRWPNIYVADRIKRIARNARIERSVLIGANSEIGDNCELVNVVVGEDCTIGPNTTLKNCILWNNVVLDSDCVVEKSILCDNTRIGAGARLHGRCLIGADVSVTSGVEIPAGTVLCKNRAAGGSDIASQDASFAPGNYVWRLAKSNDESTMELWPAFVRLDLIDAADLNATGRSSDESEGEDFGKNGVPSIEEVDGNAEPLLGEDDYDIFYQEVLESLKRGYSKQISSDNLIMEINSSKHAYNVPVAELQRRVMTAILATVLEQNKLSINTSAELVKASKSVLSHFLPLISNYFKPKNQASSGSTEMQIRCLDAIKEFVLAKHQFVPAVSQILFFFYDAEIFDEEILLAWCKQIEEPLKTQLQSFIQWLEEAEEESSESD